MNNELKRRAIKLRRKSLTYSEILKQIPVAKSTLSNWLRSVGLSKREKQKLTEKKLKAALRGSAAKHIQRLEKTRRIKSESVKQIQGIKINESTLLLMGTMLYWAEGCKEKIWMPSVRLSFSNTDADMMMIYLLWIKRILKINKDRLRFRIYIHKNKAKKIEAVKRYWSTKTGFPVSNFGKITYKRHKVESPRRNNGKDYYGLLNVTVSKSTDLNRKVAGWVDGVVKQCGMV